MLKPTSNYAAWTFAKLGDFYAILKRGSEDQALDE
jgi:hypothetical protein